MNGANHRGQGLVVSGCLPQRFREELPKLLPEVDAFMGIDQVAQVTEIVKQAWARRAQRIENSPKSKAQSPRSAKMTQDENRAARDITPHASRLTSHPSRLTPHESITAVHAQPSYIPDYTTPRFRLTPRHFAYVKIAEGCNHPCSFCTIPRMRGAHRSRQPADIVSEARVLLAEGVKELNLISQDSTYYGLDLRPHPVRAIAAPEKFRAALQSLPPAGATICTLLRQLNALPGDFWIRLLYTHPAHWTDELIQTIAECPKVARYVDIPLQHIHQNLLERMRRETSQDYIVELLQRIRAGVPGISLRTTFIVGFPGETEAHFQALLDFICQAKFERLGVFTYSQEVATLAGKMAGQIPDKIKRQRRELAMAAQREISARISGSFVGRTLKVLVEKQLEPKELKLNGMSRVRSWEHGLLRGQDQHRLAVNGHPYVARGEADAPDIDGRVYVRGNLPLGQFAQVKIIGHTDYDLIAEPV